MANQTKTAGKTKHPYFATIIVIVAVFTLCSLGYWQMMRAQEKQQRLDSIARKEIQHSLSLPDLKQMQGDIRDLPFSIKGKIRANEYFLIDNKIHNGTPGYEVYVPVATADGIVLVNFGWVSAGKYRSELPSIKLPGGEVQLFGMSAVPSNNPMITETASAQDAWPVVLQQFDFDLIAEKMSQSILPVTMLLDEADPAGFVRDWQPVVMLPEKHYGYAIQWFGLAIACLVIYLLALRKRKVVKHG